MPGYKFTITPDHADGFTGVQPSIAIHVNTGDAEPKAFKKWLKKEKDDIAQALIDQQPSWLKEG